jgi:hypothetical protein
MTVWWGKESFAPARFVEGTRIPLLFRGERGDVADAVRARLRGFVPTWRPRGDDPGNVLVRLFSEAVETVDKRLRRWPEKALIEYLATAGVAQLPPSPAHALVTFTVADTAERSVFIPAGFQLEAQPLGADEPIVFETERDLFATPAPIAALATADGTRLLPLPPSPPAPWRPFSATGARALWIGFGGDKLPGPRLTLGFGVTRGESPEPAHAGGVLELPVPPRPSLIWELLDGDTVVPVEVIVDDTDALARSGTIEIAVPSTWRPGIPLGLDSTDPLRWLSARVAGGPFASPVELDFIAVNSVVAIAAHTIRDEALDPVPDSDRAFHISQTPVLPGTLVLEVDEGEETAVRWREVSDLGVWGPDDRVFVLDPTSGVVTFGDGVHGMLVPAGFRHVHAVEYRAAGVLPGAVDANAITTLRSAAANVVGVTNRAASTGADEAEPYPDAVRRGPQEVRARHRAVTVADYELFAPQTLGADVRRAHAWQGHPSSPEAILPGVVTVVVVPADRGHGPPMPDGESLAAVAEMMSRDFAPAGVEVVATAPYYHHVRVEADVILDPTASVGDVIGEVLADLDRYLHPLTGGDAGDGWPFGGTIVHTALVRRIASHARVRAVPRLELVVDGERFEECSDVPLRPHALIWPETHELIPTRGATP